MSRIQIIVSMIIVVPLYCLCAVLTFTRIKKDKKHIYITIVCYAIIAWFIFLIFLLVTHTGYYDKLGNVYRDAHQVLYYSRTGEIYRLSGEYYGEGYFVNTEFPSDKHLDSISFITSEGYIVFDDYHEKYSEIRDMFVFTDKQGNIVFNATSISWSWSGRMK